MSEDDFVLDGKVVMLQDARKRFPGAWEHTLLKWLRVMHLEKRASILKLQFNIVDEVREVVLIDINNSGTLWQAFWDVLVTIAELRMKPFTLVIEGSSFSSSIPREVCDRQLQFARVLFLQQLALGVSVLGRDL
jgi:hypothetical protein